MGGRLVGGILDSGHSYTDLFDSDVLLSEELQVVAASQQKLLHNDREL